MTKRHLLESGQTEVFPIKQNNHKFTQLRNKDLSSSLDVHLISSLSFIAKTLVNTKVSATFIRGQVEYMV